MGSQATLPSEAFTCRESTVHLNQVPFRKVEFCLIFMNGINYFVNVLLGHCYVLTCELTNDTCSESQNNAKLTCCIWLMFVADKTHALIS